jgi:hypothetical protein
MSASLPRGLKAILHHSKPICAMSLRVMNAPATACLRTVAPPPLAADPPDCGEEQKGPNAEDENGRTNLTAQGPNRPRVGRKGEDNHVLLAQIAQ